MRPFVTIFTIGIALAMPSAPVQGGVYFADAKLKTAVEASLGVLDPTETRDDGTDLFGSDRARDKQI